MATFRCKCGYLIGFHVGSCRYDSSVMRDQGFESMEEARVREVTAFLASVREGHRAEWLKQVYGEAFPIEDANVISDIVCKHDIDFALALHQCERCGRLWLQSKPGENVYASYRPEGAWRGALETPAEGFVGYVDGQDCFEACITGIVQEAEQVYVRLQRGEAERFLVTFFGVSAVERHGLENKRVRFLSEWASTPPLRRFVFDSTNESYEPLLEITAQEVRIGNSNAPLRERSRTCE